jgi:hypothetical protein
MEVTYSEYADVYGDMEGIVSGVGPSASTPPETQKAAKRNVIVDDQHPFDLELYVSSYTGK